MVSSALVDILVVSTYKGVRRGLLLLKIKCPEHLRTLSTPAVDLGRPPLYKAKNIHLTVQRKKLIHADSRL